MNDKSNANSATTNGVIGPDGTLWVNAVRLAAENHADAERRRAEQKKKTAKERN